VDAIPAILVINTEGREIGRFYLFREHWKFIEEVKNCKEADNNLKKAESILAQKKDSAEGLYLRGLGRIYKRKAEEAKSDWKKVAEKEPKGEQTKWVRKALYKLAQIAQVEKNMDVRDTYYKKLIGADPKNESGLAIEAHYTLGISAMVGKDTELMKKHFEAARTLDPQDKAGFADDIAFAGAIAPYYKRDFKAAAGGIEKFIEKYKESELVPKAKFQLAVCCYYLKDKAKAIDIVEKLLKNHPGVLISKKAEKLLKRLKKQ